MLVRAKSPEGVARSRVWLGQRDLPYVGSDPRLARDVSISLHRLCGAA